MTRRVILLGEDGEVEETTLVLADDVTGEDLVALVQAGGKPLGAVPATPQPYDARALISKVAALETDLAEAMAAGMSQKHAKRLYNALRELSDPAYEAAYPERAETKV